MSKFPRSRVSMQDRLAERAAKAERLERVSSNPETPWLIGKIAALEAWRQRPTRLEQRIATSTDARLARMDARVEAADQHAEERLQATLEKYHGLKAGEPEPTPELAEVIYVQFGKQAATVPQSPDRANNPPQQPGQIE